MQLPLIAEPLHLEPGDDVRVCLQKLAAHQKRRGFVLSVVGNLAQAAFQCPGKTRSTVLRGEFEIITLTGTLAPEGVHLHLSFSDGDCQVWGGHLEPGSLVLKGADLLVGWLDDPATTAATEASPAAAKSAARSAAPCAAAAPRVRIAVKTGCPYSARALRMLRTLGIEHEQVEPLAGRSVPQIWIDNEMIGGYDALAALHGQGTLESLRTL
jgi:predicted DNA-binding protein with PD1-like motif/glutaredoxin